MCGLLVVTIETEQLKSNLQNKLEEIDFLPYDRYYSPIHI